MAHIIKKYYTQADDADDLISIGTIGLIKGINTYRPEKGVRLATYAAAQIKAMKQVAGKIKLELAQYREMAAFAQFASDLDQSTKNLLARGERLTELLKQPVYHPMPVAEEVIAIFAGVRGYLDKIPVGEVKSFETKALAAVKASRPEFLEQIREEKVISEELDKKLTEFFDGFLNEFIGEEKAA